KHQNGDEREQDQPEDFSGNQRAQLLDCSQALQDPIQHAEHAGPECAAHERQDDQLPCAALGAFLAQPLQCGAPLGLEDMRQRRLSHLPSTSASSRICAPPVSFRNSSSRLASPAWCWRRTSSTVPAATILPCWMIAIGSHIVSAISSVCV